MVSTEPPTTAAGGWANFWYVCEDPVGASSTTLNKIDVYLEDRERFEKLFGEGMDKVETLVTQKMTRKKLPLEVVGAAVQMWMEYRICIGRRPLIIRKPETWASALDYTIRKINFNELSQREIAEIYGVSPSTVRAYHNDLVQALDIMPCDFRYFRGDENPLDRLIEAAAMLEELEERFRQP